MKLKEVQKHWHALGKADPLWAILTDFTKRNRKWEKTEFFKTGEEEISRVMEYLASLGVPLARNRALDFGCGVGRLTQPLCRYFEECWGVDIAPSMIRLAEQYNQYGSKCHYCLNQANNLRMFADNWFDFIYSNIVLQHLEPPYSKQYIKEFIRVLAPGGLAIFQLPSERIPKGRIMQPLPDSAFRAQITSADPVNLLKAGSQTTVWVKVKNLSDMTWPALGATSGQYRINLGSRWLARGARAVPNQDGRAPLSMDLKPGGEAVLPVVITAPKQPGGYTLELDMVQEEVAWFHDRGSQPTRMNVQILPGEGLLARLQRLWQRSRSFTPRIEMYEVSKAEVLELVPASGGKVVDVQEDPMGRPVRLGFRYVVTKS